MQYLESQGSNFKHNSTTLINIKQQFNDVFDLIKHCNVQEQKEILQYIQHYIDTKSLLLETSKIERNVKKRNWKKLNNDKLVKIFFKCKICNNRRKTKLGLLKHLQDHEGIPSTCTSCNKIFKNKLSYYWHRKHLCKNRKFKIENSKSCIIYHMQKRDIYKCLTCNKFFLTKTRAYFHYKSVHLVKNIVPQFRCLNCLHTFHRQRQFHKHICKQQDQSAVVYQTIYDKKSPNQYYEQSKIKSILCKKKILNRNYKCPTGDKKFLHKYSLKRHASRSHLDKTTLLSCKYCNYKSRLKPNMERHINLHFSNERNCMCDHCGKTFTNTASLTDHIKYLHIQEKQFKCEICDKSFKRKFELVRHRSCHSEVRPYVCELCQQTYKRLNHLSRHKKTAHKVVLKSKTVQRLKVNETGGVVPIPKEQTLDLKTKPGVTSSNINSSLKNVIYLFDSNVVNQHSTSANACILLQHQPGIKIANLVNSVQSNHNIFSRNLQSEESSYNSVVYQID